MAEAQLLSFKLYPGHGVPGKAGPVNEVRVSLCESLVFDVGDEVEGAPVQRLRTIPPEEHSMPACMFVGLLADNQVSESGEEEEPLLAFYLRETNEHQGIVLMKIEEAEELEVNTETPGILKKPTIIWGRTFRGSPVAVDTDPEVLDSLHLPFGIGTRVFDSVEKSIFTIRGVGVAPSCFAGGVWGQADNGDFGGRAARAVAAYWLPA